MPFYSSKIVIRNHKVNMSVLFFMYLSENYIGMTEFSVTLNNTSGDSKSKKSTSAYIANFRISI